MSTTYNRHTVRCIAGEKGTVGGLDEKTKEVTGSCNPMTGKPEIIPLGKRMLHAVALNTPINRSTELHYTCPELPTLQQPVSK